MNKQAADFKTRLETGENNSGSFFTALGDLIPLADGKNRDLLRLSFPEMVEVWEVFKGWDCKHTKLVYIGEQEILDGAPLYLYNCRNCNTTISKKRFL